MAESLRDLVVSLSLNSDNFTRNIKSVNKQIQEAESRFKLASAGTENFEKSVAGLSAKSDTLQRKLKLQKDAVKQYEGALAAANSKLQECYTRQTTYAQRLAEAKAKQADLANEVNRATSTYEQYKSALGESNSATIAAKQNMESANAEYEKATQEVEKLAGQEDALQRATQNAADAVSTAEKNLNNAKAAVKTTEAELKKTNEALKVAKSSWTQAGEAMESFGKKCKEVGESAEKIGKKLTTYVTTPIVGLATAAVKASIDFESSFTSVRKTVDATEEQFAELEKASKRMSTELAASTTEINEVMATGGQLGIGADNLEEFTKIMIDLGNSCEDLTAGEAATSLAKFSNVMQSGQDKFDQMGATLVDLGNNYATTEKAIMEMSQRLAGAGHQVGLTEAEVMGFAAALSSVGIEAQMGGSAFSKALVKMDVAVATGNKDLKSFADICGITTDQFKTLWKSNPAGVFQSFITGLAGMNEEGISAIAVLNDIGISEIRLRDTLLRATNASELFSKAQNTAKKAWGENTALAVEANKRYGTTASKITNLKNKATLFAQTLGDDLNPMIQNVIGGVSDFIDRLNEMDSSERATLVTLAAVAASVGPVLVAFGKITKIVGETSESLGKFSKGIGSAMASISTKVAEAGGGFSGLLKVLASSPAVWAAVGVAVVAGLVKLNDYISGAKRAREAQERLNKTVEQWKENVRTAFEDASGLSSFGLSSSNFDNRNTGASWLERTLAEWQDGKKETKETVNAVVQEFTDGTDEIRTAMKALKETAGGGEIGEISKDIAELDKIDSKIEKLLNKKRNKNLTEKDIEELQSLINQRDALQIKYKLVPDSDAAFDTIVDGVESALSRGANSADTFNEAYAAATQGLGSYIDSLNEEYDARHRIISAMSEDTDEEKAKKTAEMEKLAAWYAEQKASATAKYYETIAQISEKTGAFDDGGNYDETIKKLEEIQKLMDEAAGKDTNSEEMSKLRDALAGLGDSESSIVEMAAAIASMKAAAEEAGVEVPEGVKKAEEALKSAMTTASDTKNVFSEDVQKSLDDMFGGVGEEVHEVYATLNCDNLSTAYDAWAVGEHADIIPSLNTEGLDLSGLNNLTGTVTAYTYDGKGVTVDLASLNTLTGTVTVYDDKGNATTTNLSQLSGLTGTVVGYTPTGDAITFPAQALSNMQGTVTTLSMKPTAMKLSELENLTGYVTAYTYNGKGVQVDLSSLNSLTGEVTVYTEKGDAITTKLSKLKNLEGTVTGYTPTGEAITFPATALADMKGTVTMFEISPDAVVPTVKVKGEIDFEQGQFTNSGNPELEYSASNQTERSGILFGATIFTSDEQTKKIHNLAEAIQEYKKAINEGADPVIKDAWIQSIWNLADALSFDLTDADGVGFQVIAQSIANGLQLLAEGKMSPEEIEKFKTSYQDLMTILGSDEGLAALDTNLGDRGWGEGLAQNLSDKLNEYGWDTTAEDVAGKINTAFSTASESVKTAGDDIAAGVGQGMAVHDYSADAETTVANAEEGIRNAAESHSPAVRFNPVGDDIAAGVGQGMTLHDFSTDAGLLTTNLAAAMAAALTADLLNPIGNTAIVGLASGMTSFNLRGPATQVGTNARLAVASAMPQSAFRQIGVNAMKGLTAGINAGRSGVIAAMRSAALAAVQEAKKQLKIKSPSRVFRDEVGAMTMKGFTEGIKQESKATAKAIKNASRYLTGQAKEGTINYGSTDNSRTYNESFSTNLTGNNFYVRDEQDVHSLAIEIAALTRTRQRGRGLRTLA